MIRVGASSTALMVLLALTLVACDSLAESLPTLTPTITASLSPTVTPTITPSPTPTPPLISEHGEAGFDVHLAATGPIPADGRSTVIVEVTTTRAEFAGLPVVLVPFGGGRIEPAEVILPPLGEKLTVLYKAGEAASSVRIEGRVLRAEGESIDSAEMQVVLEHFTLQMEYSQPISRAPVVVPIRLWLNPTSPTEMLRGHYMVRLATLNNEGMLSLSPNVSDGKAEQQVLIPPDGEVQVYFTPNASTQATLRAQILGRNDVNMVRVVLYWDNVEHDTQISNTPGWATTNVPEGSELYRWALNAQNYVCAWFYDANNRQILPPVAQFNYDMLLAPPDTFPHLFMQREEILTGNWYRSDETALNGRPYLAVDFPTCATLYTGNGPGALFRVRMAGAFPNQAAKALLLLYNDVITWQTLNLSLLPTSGDRVLFSWPASAVPIYRLVPTNFPVPQPIILAGWIPSASVDTINDALRGTGPTKTLTLIADLDAYRQGAAPIEIPIGDQAITQVWIAQDPAGTPYTASVSFGDRIEIMQRVYIMGWLYPG